MEPLCFKGIPIPSAQSTTEVRIDIRKSNEHPSEQIKIVGLGIVLNSHARQKVLKYWIKF